MDVVETLVERLDQSLLLMAQGVSPRQCAARFPEHAEELLPLLRVVQILRRWASLTPRQEAVEQGYVRAMAALDARYGLDATGSVEIPAACPAPPDTFKAGCLAHRILALEEPWRSRFVSFILSYSDSDVPAPSAALRQALIAGLLDDELYPLAVALVQAWCHEQ